MCLAIHDAGDVAGAWDCMRQDVDRAYGRLIALDDAARVDEMLADIADGSHLLDDERYRSALGRQLPRGPAATSMAPRSTTWPGEPPGTSTRAMSRPRRCCGTASSIRRVPPAHGRWYADQIADADLVILPGEGHVDVIDGHWPEVLTRPPRPVGHDRRSERLAGHDRTPSPPSDGVLWPDELLTSSSAGRHPDHRSREPPIVPCPQAARRHVVRYVLAAWTARTAGRRPRINSMARATIAPTRMAEKATWRIGACMSVRRRPPSSCFIVFRRFDGNLVRGVTRTWVVKREQMFYSSQPPASRLSDRSDPWHRPRTPNSIATPISRSSMGHPRPTTWSSEPSNWG